jgi:hypothetical protein
MTVCKAVDTFVIPNASLLYSFWLKYDGGLSLLGDVPWTQPAKKFLTYHNTQQTHGIFNRQIHKQQHEEYYFGHLDDLQ